MLGDIVLRVCAAPMPVPSQVNPAVPPGFDASVRPARAAQPGEGRFRTAEELAQALASVSGVERRCRPRRSKRIAFNTCFAPTLRTATWRRASKRPSNHRSPRTALLAGLVINGVTLMVALVAGARSPRSILGGCSRIGGPTLRTSRIGDDDNADARGTSAARRPRCARTFEQRSPMRVNRDLRLGGDATSELDPENGRS